MLLRYSCDQIAMILLIFSSLVFFVSSQATVSHSGNAARITGDMSPQQIVTAMCANKTLKTIAGTGVTVQLTDLANCPQMIAVIGQTQSYQGDYFIWDVTRVGNTALTWTLGGYDLYTTNARQMSTDPGIAVAFMCGNKTKTLGISGVTIQLNNFVNCIGISSAVKQRQSGTFFIWDTIQESTGQTTVTFN